MFEKNYSKDILFHTIIFIQEELILNLVNKLPLFHLLSQTLKPQILINSSFAPNKYGYNFWIIIHVKTKF